VAIVCDVGIVAILKRQLSDFWTRPAADKSSFRR